MKKNRKLVIDLTRMETESIIKNLPIEKSPVMMVSMVIVNKHLKN